MWAALVAVAPAPYHGASNAGGSNGPTLFAVALLALALGIGIGILLMTTRPPGGGGGWWRRPRPETPRGPKPPKPGPIPDFIPDAWIAEHAASAWRKVRDTFGTHV